MKSIVRSSAWSAAVLVMGLAQAVNAAEPAAQAVSERELQAKLHYCTSCHQQSGQGYMGATPIPRLAGQQPEYFQNQLQAFIDRRRVNNFMFKVAHSLSPAMLKALAQHFKDLNPRPYATAPKNLASSGKKIFDEGVPTANVPACAVCHGPEAKGNGEMPRLAGQLYAYTRKALSNWGQERGQDPAKPDMSAVMQPIAHGLSEAQVAAVAAYLDQLN